MSDPEPITPADPITALAEILGAVIPGVGVFGGELPEAENAAMPQRVVVIRASGGISLTGGSNAEADTQRVDVFSYGATPRDASQLDAIVSLALRRVERVVAAGTLIHWVNSAGGFVSGRDPETDWPRVFRSFQVFSALQSVS